MIVDQKFNRHLMNQRDGLMRELEYITKRRDQLCEQITELNTRIAPHFDFKDK